MSVYAGHLDELLNQTFSATSVSTLAFVSGTTNQQNYSLPTLATLKATSVGYMISAAMYPAPHTFQFKISAVNDTLGTIILSEYFDNTFVTSATEHVLGYSAGSMLISMGDAQLIGSLVFANQDVSNQIFALSPVDLGSGTALSFSANGTYTGGSSSTPVPPTPVTPPGTTVVPLLKYQAVVTVTAGNGTVTGPGVSDALSSAPEIHFIDGTLAFGAATLEAQAARIYQAAFGRTPDASGLSYWVGVLQGGTSLADIAAGFIGSAEFTARYGSLNDAGFVNALYLNVLGRAADASGSAYWTGALTNRTMTRAQVLASFSEGTENKADTAPLLSKGLWCPDEHAASAARLYYATLGRAPDAAGLSFWTSQIESSAATLQQEANNFVTSAEFASRYGNLDDAGFVNLLYQNVLGRPADQNGLAFWTDQIAHGGSRSGVVLGFSESTELKARLAPVIEQNGIVVA